MYLKLLFTHAKWFLKFVDDIVNNESPGSGVKIIALESLSLFLNRRVHGFLFKQSQKDSKRLHNVTP